MAILINMLEPLVSIIIPVYNARAHLDECINSAINQAWPTKELIIVDDGSTDNSFAIAEKYVCDWIKVFYQENKGAGAARNKGLQEARGEYIQFLDADDILSTDKIKKQILQLQTKPDHIAVCSTVHFTNGTDHLTCNPSVYEEVFLTDADPVHFLINLWGGYSENGSMVQPNAWLTPAHVIKKAGNWNETLTVDDDGEFFCRVLLAATGVIKTDGLNYYRKYQHSTSLSARKLQENYLSLYHSLKLKYLHISKKDASQNLKIAYLKSLYALKNSIYPSFPQLKRQISDSINDLGMDISFEQSNIQKLKKIISLVIAGIRPKLKKT